VALCQAVEAELLWHSFPTVKAAANTIGSLSIPWAGIAAAAAAAAAVTGTQSQQSFLLKYLKVAVAFNS
jgi:hypothetical protein